MLRDRSQPAEEGVPPRSEVSPPGENTRSAADCAELIEAHGRQWRHGKQFEWQGEFAGEGAAAAARTRSRHSRRDMWVPYPPHACRVLVAWSGAPPAPSHKFGGFTGTIRRASHGSGFEADCDGVVHAIRERPADTIEPADASAWCAVRDGDPGRLSRALGEGGNPDFRGPLDDRSTLLHLACRTGKVGCARVLLESTAEWGRADHWLLDANGQTPLDVCLGEPHIFTLFEEMMRRLDVEETGQRNPHELMTAVFRERVSLGLRVKATEDTGLDQGIVEVKPEGQAARLKALGPLSGRPLEAENLVRMIEAEDVSQYWDADFKTVVKKAKQRPLVVGFAPSRQKQAKLDEQKQAAVDTTRERERQTHHYEAVKRCLAAGSEAITRGVEFMHSSQFAKAQSEFERGLRPVAECGKNSAELLRHRWDLEQWLVVAQLRHNLSQDHFAEAAAKLEQTRDFPKINGCVDAASASTGSETLLRAITDAEAAFEEAAKNLFASRREAVKHSTEETHERVQLRESVMKDLRGGVEALCQTTADRALVGRILLQRACETSDDLMRAHSELQQSMGHKAVHHCLVDLRLAAWFCRRANRLVKSEYEAESERGSGFRIFSSKLGAARLAYVCAKVALRGAHVEGDVDMKRDKVMIQETQELVKALADSIDLRIAGVTAALQRRNSVRMGANDGERALRSWAAETALQQFNRVASVHRAGDAHPHEQSQLQDCIERAEAELARQKEVKGFHQKAVAEILIPGGAHAAEK
eukprot:COSAG05_NODE_2906_length_2522_cov_3.814280_1_plen_757_part_01